MKLQEFLRHGLSLPYDKINDEQLADHIQRVLIWHKVLESEADGLFGRISTYSLCHFQKIHGIDENYLGVETTKALINFKPEKTNELMQSVKSNFLDLVIAEMEDEGFLINKNPQEINIVFVEGVDLDFCINADTPNIFNDLCLVFDFVGNNPRILGKWVSTADPGRYYTDNPLNPRGCLHHNGQSQAWQVGRHKDHEALVQVRAIPITRDYNQDFRTRGDKNYSGFFGANCHGSNTNNIDNISRWSAGCKVVYQMQKFREFMGIVKKDCRYKRDKKHIFRIGTLEATSLLKFVRDTKAAPETNQIPAYCKAYL